MVCEEEHECNIKEKKEWSNGKVVEDSGGGEWWCVRVFGIRLRSEVLMTMQIIAGTTHHASE